ncbi:SDR family oxidoreductase [Aestuariicella hydrocarbonica]|uniref:SDR family oxidoreductase n=1 Tax=Pseudomaricurvus hydrocarbonicus TaxID=1470433 RepID=A0A9E5JUK7_9GAMM|nr:SDR family oxidoreductase [Aestuariicella hydrocarbonica]NHO66839.1 SDR family oxidoreductase [Aestuariicella hydrocarbonica]
MTFEHKVALVTGGAEGIGAGIVERLSKKGAKVYIGDINEDKSLTLARLFKNVEFLSLDVCEESQWQAAIETIERKSGQLDILIQSAGISRPGSIEEVDLDEWRDHMRVHGEGAFLGCKYAVASMKKSGGGAIVNISSVESIRPGPLFTCYGAAKAAQDAVTKTVALHCGEMGYNIRCNSLHPAATYTPLLEQYLASAEDPEALEKVYAGMQPLNRIATVDEVARCCLFLASEDASFITGHQMYVDGGVLAKPYPSGQGA